MVSVPNNPEKAPGSLPVAIALSVVAVGGYVVGDRHGRRAASVAAPALVATPPPAPVVALAQPAAAASDGGFEVAAGPASPAPEVLDAGLSSERVIAATLKGSLDEAIVGLDPGDGPALTMVVSRLLVWWLNPARDVRPGDRLWLVYETPAGQEPLVLGLRYQSLKLGITRTLVRFQAPGAPYARYYDDTGAELEERLVDSPLDDYEQITSLLRDGRGHKGVDFKVPVGAEVHSPVEGVVTRRNWNFHSNGDCVAIRDQATRRELMFLHLSAVADGVKVGAPVHQGQVLGKTGNTGHTTAPHLHYQMMSPATPPKVLDPFVVQATTRQKLVGEPLAAFKAASAELAPKLGGR